MNLSATIAKMVQAGMPADQIVKAIECLEINTKGMRVHNTRPNDKRCKSGPKERWGYTGPVTPRLPEKEWQDLRGYILERDEFVCGYCNASGEDDVHWCVDHIVPLSRGGSNEEDNLTACCVPCNNSKRDMLVAEWRGRGK